MRKIIPLESIEDKKRKLCFAARRGDMGKVKQFFAEGLDANCIFEGNGYITTPLESAIGGNQEEMMRFLIDEGADPSSRRSHITCLGISKWPYEKRLRMIEILYTKKPEMAEEIAEYILLRIGHLREDGRLDETLNSEKSQAIIAELTQINQSRLDREQSLKELAEQTRKTLSLDKMEGRRKSSDEETKSGSSSKEADPNHKNPTSKIRPNPSQSSPIVPMATNGGCVIS